LLPASKPRILARRINIVLSFIIIITDFKLTGLDHLLSYKSHSVQYAAVSQPNMNELAATKFPLRSANELQTDGYTTAGRIAERSVRWCSSVIIEQQYMYYMLVTGTRR
jgi:hypothetical protein